MILTAFTLFHVALSLVGIGSGLVILYGFLAAKWLVAGILFFWSPRWPQA